jgi:2-polyprenyl-3-methyl-5-hydroxy-6-metoxy-1,4-benzoquinol methylase
MAATIPLETPKGSDYYSQNRAELVARVPRPLGRVLDVGCGAGGIAGPLRAAGASWVAGIEVVPEAAAAAERVYDEVWVGDAVASLPKVSGSFNTILCYDVLEHLYDPLALARGLTSVAVAGGRLHVSVPNASHVSLLRDLVVRGTFGYQPAGHRDATHIRWFTRRDIVCLLEEAGWSVQAIAPSGLQSRSRVLHRLTRGRSTEYLAAQWSVLAAVGHGDTRIAGDSASHVPEH